MNFNLEISVPVLTVLAQGLLSFFSPCVFPLVPLYIGYFSGGMRTVDDDGTVHYPRGRVLFLTVCFVLGISAAFFLLGFGFTALGKFFSSRRPLIARISGVIMILFGLYQFGVFGRADVLERERRLPFRFALREAAHCETEAPGGLHIRHFPDRLFTGPFSAFLLGFTFSFAWTPCIGPTLSSVLLLAGSAGNAARGLFLISVYTFGFILPFLAVGLFTGTVLEFFRKHKNVVQYTVKIGALLLVFMGIMTLTGFMNGLTGYLSGLDGLFSEQANTEGTHAEILETEDIAESSAEITEDSAGIPEKITESTIIGKDAAKPGETAGTGTAGEEKAAEAETSEKGDDGSTEVSARQNSTESAENTEKISESGTEEAEPVPAPDFTLTDQNGNIHTLSDYKGKTVFLNFWATWCPPCRGEMPEIQALYEEYGSNEEELVVLGVAAPDIGQEGDEASIVSFLEENAYTFPVVMDTQGLFTSVYGIRAYPTTFMISADGSVYGYVEGALTADIMHSIVEQTMEH